MGRHYSVDLFSPNHYWLHATTASCIEIFDLESSISKLCFPASLMLISTHREPSVLVAWSADGQTLFGGLNDNLVCIQTVTS
ncbi:G-protein receptor for activated protein kinase C [Suillus subalutaceus]|uniref:G-protein receptor for activated protein kinase C n=1 Tax=Suillus subalutaceus TaxID=48586 RepID=UPI001B861062|nr:G-protein receptor for activated protein kinase C [Suillus subalutaceus]KAG1814796.1 G-protein receptor for activated protein kinase C [Suillus subalutaceus]